MNSKQGKYIARIGLAFCTLLFTAGTLLAQTVTYNSMPGTDFAKYKTYKWVTIPGAEQPNQILDQQIKQAIDSQMAAKGFVKTSAETADLDIAYQVSITHQQEWNAYGMGGGWRMGGGMGTMTSTTLQVGTIGFDVYDEAAKTLIWRGSATKTLNPPSNPTKRQQNLDRGIAKLLQNFPPKVK
jgi:hypothetical protein